MLLAQSVSHPALSFTPRPVALPAASLTALVVAQSEQIRLLSVRLAAQSAPSLYEQPYLNAFGDASPTGPHLFFAHYQVSNGDYGKSWNLPPFQDGGTSPSPTQSRQDIEEAVTCGADGFSMDFGGNDNNYASALENMLSAGDAYNADHAADIAAGRPTAGGTAGFHSFLTFDFSGFPEDPNTLTLWIARAIKHPSYYRYHGLPFVSCYVGGGGGYAVVKSVWQPVLAALKAQGTPIYFVPGFELTDAAGNSLPGNAANWPQQMTGLLTQLPAQGTWSYGVGLGIPLSLANSSANAAESLSAAAKAAGLSYMAAVTPSYQGLDKPGRWYHEAYGGETLNHTWNSILLSQQAAWVQFVTWNDYGEYSRLTNAPEGPGSPWPYLAHSGQADYYLSTLGMQALNRYYVQWYKMGKQPRFTHDNLFAFYRTQPHSLVVPGDAANAIGSVNLEDGEGSGPSLAPDTFFIATGCTGQRTLTLVNGGQTFTKLVPAGLFFSRVGPFVPGAVTMTLTAPGAATVTLTGHAILSTATFYNWSVWSGWGHN